MYLQKALYGLKNSAKAWFDTFSSYLKSAGYSQSHYDECLWEYKNKNGKKLYVIVPVDDCLVIRDDDCIDDFISKVNGKNIKLEIPATPGRSWAWKLSETVKKEL